ncbi:MAG: ABC transporter ATP-binding protein [Desulfosarcina sp.]|nr:ABC transporter ATP-binding protein [Desulfosarcina sp.]
MSADMAGDDRRDGRRETGAGAHPILEAKDLVVNFYTYEGVVKALNGVSLTIPHGITFGLVGESGCGKSVFVRSLMGLVQEPGRIDGGELIFYPGPPSGDGPVQGVDLLRQPESYLQRIRGDRISMIFQEPNAALNPIMTVGEQVAESFLFHRVREMSEKIAADLGAGGGRTTGPVKAVLRVLCGISARNPHARVLRVLNRVPVLKRWRRRLLREALSRSAELLGRLGISNPEEVIRRYPHNLSGGMKHRIVIAMALACKPVLLIADEATSNLDVTIQAQILDLLKGLKETEISSVLLITHDLGVVAETCDRVGVMYAGNVCEIANVGELFRNPRHPYTQALLNAVPKMAQTGPLESIEGTVPNLVDPPPGCRFHPRCPNAGEPCREVFPEMREMGVGHRVACYFPVEDIG